MSTFWDSRYDTKDFVYGKEPNDFFASQLEVIRPGSILLPGEGEGRNAVHAASKGWLVDAFDQSPVAAEKALAYAAEKEVRLDYCISGIEDFLFQPDYYDAVGLIFFHVPPTNRMLLHQQLAKTLKPGGVLIFEGFHTSQLGNATGGPASRDLLFDEETIRFDFPGLEVRQLEQLSVDLKEGIFHRGDAEIIRFVGRKT